MHIAWLLVKYPLESYPYVISRPFFKIGPINLMDQGVY